MKKIYRFILGVTTISLFSCENNNFENELMANNEKLQRITVNANIANNSRVVFTDDGNNGLLVEWKDSGESFSVIRGTENITYTQESFNRFSGDIHNTSIGTFYAFYPTTSSLDITKVPFDLSVQTGSTDESKTYMLAKNEDITYDTNFDFTHLTAIIKPTFTGIGENEKIKTITIETPTVTKGFFNLTNRNVEGNGNSNISVNYFSASEINSDRYIYILPIEKNEELTFTITTDANKIYSGRITAAKNIMSGIQYSVTLNLTEDNSNLYIWYNGINASTKFLDSDIENGSKSKPFLIKTANDLQWLMQNLRNCYGKYIRLTHDIIIDSSLESNKYWTPIGLDNNYPFCSHFDGNGHTISGRLVSQYAGNNVSDKNVIFGFFGYMSTGSITNLHLNAEVIGGNTIGDYCNSWTGGIVGITQNFTDEISIYINNCTNSGNVTGGSGTTGGIVGSSQNLNIDNCYNYGNITNGKNTGGLVGASSGYCSIINSSNYGVVNGKGHTGGLVGDNSNTNIYNCQNKAVVNEGFCIGGLIGYNVNGIINSCTNEGDLTATSSTYYIGGLIGLNDGTGVLCKSKNNGLITLLTSTAYSGGLVANTTSFGVICSSSIDNSDYKINGISTPIGGGGTFTNESECSLCNP